MNVDMSMVKIAVTKPKGKVAKALAEMGVQVGVVEGDEGNIDRYLLSDRLAVERRSGAGFIKGIMEKTLFTGAIYLREHFRIPVLIVEGQINCEYTHFDPQAIRGAMSSMMLLYAINVLTTPNVEETAGLIAMMARQEQIGIPEISLIPKRKAVDLPDMQRRIVEMLPGCGMVLARQMLQHFGSFERILSASVDDFRELHGVGAKKARQMHSVLHAEYEAVDTEKDLEDAIEADPSLLFAEPVKLLGRQHYIFSDGDRRHIMDLVYFVPKANEIVLVELKRGALTLEHYRQLRRYLDRAGESALLRRYLDRGAGLRGLLATVEQCDFKPGRADVSICIVKKPRVIEVLKTLRAKRLRKRK